MRSVSLFLLSVLAAMAQGTVPQAGRIEMGASSLPIKGEGAGISYTTTVEPASKRPSVEVFGGHMVSREHKGTIHRYLVDPAHLRYVGYDLTVEPGLATGQFTVTISPLTLPPSEFNLGISTLDPNSLQSVALPRYPAPQDVQAGDTVALDLLVSPDGQTKVVDYLQIWIGSVHSQLGATSSGAGAPRDYSADDGPAVFALARIKVMIEGQPAAAVGVKSTPGAALWVAAPYHGRYILSLQPRAGFEKVGTIRHNDVSFEMDGQKYQILAQNAVQGNGPWNLYGTHDSLYVSSQDAVLIGTDRPENLLANQ
jgi:hypothetical protein